MHARMLSGSIISLLSFLFLTSIQMYPLLCVINFFLIAYIPQ